MVFYLHPDALGAAERPQHEDAVFADVVHGVAQKVMQSALHHVGSAQTGSSSSGISSLSCQPFWAQTAS